jgi:SAM-dependent methyltransferase
MFEFHADRKRYFDIQVLNAQRHVLPFISKAFTVRKGMRVLEIGCGEGGVLKAFIGKGCTCVGVDTDGARVENAKAWLAEDIREGKARFLVKDIYEVDIPQDTGGAFNIIILKDVIEHIHDQPRLMAWMKSMLVPGGIIFFGFPPWQMPFGGHQQMCSNKWLSKLPYYHLLPSRIYRSILQKFNEPVDDLMEIRKTGLSIEYFESMVRQKEYTIVHKLHYLVNPIYEWKFGIKPLRQLPVIRDIPFLRNYITTCVYYMITPSPSPVQ